MTLGTQWFWIYKDLEGVNGYIKEFYNLKIIILIIVVYNLIMCMHCEIIEEFAGEDQLANRAVKITQRKDDDFHTKHDTDSHSMIKADFQSRLILIYIQM